MKKIVLAMLSSMCVYAQAQTAYLPVECGTLKDLTTVLTEYEEKPFATGETKRQTRGSEKTHVVLMFVNSKTGTWTVVEKVGDDKYCVLTGGTNFFVVESKKI